MSANEEMQYFDYDQLIARHRDLIRGLCMLYAGGDSELSMELLQMCYISLWRYLPTLREDAAPWQERAWVAWQCRSVFSHFRQRRREGIWEPIDSRLAETLTEPNLEELRERLEELAEPLNSYERRAFDLMAEGCSAEDLAEELGIKRKSAVQLRYRIIKKIREHFNIKPYEDKK